MISWYNSFLFFMMGRLPKGSSFLDRLWFYSFLSEDYFFSFPWFKAPSHVQNDTFYSLSMLSTHTGYWHLLQKSQNHPFSSLLCKLGTHTTLDDPCSNNFYWKWRLLLQQHISKKSKAKFSNFFTAFFVAWCCFSYFTVLEKMICDFMREK